MTSSWPTEYWGRPPTALLGFQPSPLPTPLVMVLTRLTVGMGRADSPRAVLRCFRWRRKTRKARARRRTTKSVVAMPRPTDREVWDTAATEAFASGNGLSVLLPCCCWTFPEIVHTVSTHYVPSFLSRTNAISVSWRLATTRSTFQIEALYVK